MHHADSIMVTGGIDYNKYPLSNKTTHKSIINQTCRSPPVLLSKWINQPIETSVVICTIVKQKAESSLDPKD